MLDVVENILMTLAVVVSTFYVWCKLLNKRLDFKSKRFWIILLGLISFIILNYYMVNKFLRIISVTIVFMIACSYLLKVEFKQGVIAALISQLMTMVAETIFVITISFIFKSGGEFIENTQFATILANVCIATIVILLAQFKFIKKLYDKLTKFTMNISDLHLMSIIIVFVFCLNIFSMIAYYQLDFKMMLLFNVATMVIYFIVIMTAFKNKNDYIEISDKYNTTITSLKEYEDILNNYRVSNHENKNQLLTIRNMVKSKEKNIISYIDKIVENELQDNENLMGQSMIIPEGGLRGLVYSKMLLMKSKNIDFDLSVDKSIRTVQLIELGEQTMLDICKIVGVFLDNAIEAVENLDEKFIDFEMSVEGKKLSIFVTNNFEGTIDIEHMEDKGFSTKGGNHGYGLTLVKKLVSGNRLLKNEKHISHDEFTQQLIINISKLK